MKMLGAVPRCLPLILWMFTAPSRSQGTYGFKPGGTCDNYGANYFYVGCFDTGYTTTGPNLTVDSTTIGWGGGLGVSTFAIQDPGPVIPYQTSVQDSFWGLPVNSSYWTDGRTPYNCSIACRAHGFKYLVLQDSVNVCQCATYLPTSFATQWPGDNPKIAPHCSDPVQIGTPGDRNSLGGWIATYPAGMVGQANSMWYQDPSFKTEAVLQVTPNLGTNFAYWQCMGAGISAKIRPQGFQNWFTTLASCFQFCANARMPYAGASWNAAGGTHPTQQVISA